MVQWGDPIEVNGQRPGWLRDEDWNTCAVLKDGRRQVPGANTMRNTEEWQWEVIKAIELPADHPYYLATSKGYTYWPGGDAAPEDWNGSKVLLRNGTEIGNHTVSYWKHVHGLPGVVIIGYRKRAADQCCNRTVQVGHRCAGCPHEETSNHMAAAPAPDIESPMFVPQAPAITPEFIALVVNERDSLRKRVTDLLLANNRYVEERRASENWQAAFERSQDDLATVTAERDAYRQEARAIASGMGATPWNF